MRRRSRFLSSPHTSDTMSQSELSGGSVSLGDMREVARLELLELLDSFPGSKTLIWDSALTGPMGLVAEYSVLKQHQVTIIIIIMIRLTTIV